MKIGIMLYSQTGNALSVAEKLQAKLEEAGHSTHIERLAGADAPQAAVDLAQYEGLIFASPVQAFSMARPMANFLAGLPTLEGKPCAAYVTKSIPNDWTGGNKAVRQIRQAVESHGGKFAGHGIIAWNSKTREEDIAALVERFAGLF